MASNERGNVVACEDAWLVKARPSILLIGAIGQVQLTIPVVSCGVLKFAKWQVEVVGSRCLRNIELAGISDNVVVAPAILHVC